MIRFLPIMLPREVPGVLLQAVLLPGDRTKEGQLIEAVAYPWFEIIGMIEKDPSRIYGIPWREWEEIVAGAYRQQGFNVTLTPASGDGGRDIIAESNGVGCIRYVDQVKAYKPGHLVTADEVRSMVGVLGLDPNVSKGIVTTTSEFAPGIEKDQRIKGLMPYRLELKPRVVLLDWLKDIAAGSSLAGDV